MRAEFNIKTSPDTTVSLVLETIEREHKFLTVLLGDAGLKTLYEGDSVMEQYRVFNSTKAHYEQRARDEGW